MWRLSALLALGGLLALAAEIALHGGLVREHGAWCAIDVAEAFTPGPACTMPLVQHAPSLETGRRGRRGTSCPTLPGLKPSPTAVWSLWLCTTSPLIMH